MSHGPIHRVAVLGAGTMGRGIAAQLANAHVEVDLLDIVPEEAPEPAETGASEARNRLAREAIEAMVESRRPQLFEERLAELIRPGNVEDHLARLGEADWVVEAVPEELSIKRETLDKIESHADENAIVSSNTSGLSIRAMLEGRAAEFRRRFLVTHFFNPVRLMKLVELVPAEETEPGVVETIERFTRDALGKGVVFGKDTTNFVANRIGVHDQMVVLHERENFGLSFEDVDQILREPMGRPSSAVFKLLDIIGIDTVVHAAENCHENLTDDENRQLYRVPDYLHEMVERGWLGRKSGQGFYRKTDEGIEALRLVSWDYELRDFTDFESLEAAEGSPARRVRSIVVEGEDRAAEFARVVTLRSVAYAARRLGEIAEDVVNIDRALRWGFNWDLGPFEIWDAIGLEWGYRQMREREIEVPEWVESMLEAGYEGFYRRDGASDHYFDPMTEGWEPVPEDPKRLEVSTLRRRESPVLENDSATMHDMGDGVALVEFHSKMNAVDDEIIELLYGAIEEVERNWRALVVGNDGEHFSAGADLRGLLERAEAREWEAIREHSRWFQQLNQRLRYSSRPVVAAPFGFTLGGGAELAMAADLRVADAELTMGLVETGVGIVPGAGGNLQLLRHTLGDAAENSAIDALPYVRDVFRQIREGAISGSADEARNAGFLRSSDSVVLNGDHVLHAAKCRALALAESGYRRPLQTAFHLPGSRGIETLEHDLEEHLERGEISEHDRRIGREVARILCGGEDADDGAVSEERLLELERDAFVRLCREEKSRDRMRHMLEHGRRLDN